MKRILTILILLSSLSASAQDGLSQLSGHEAGIAVGDMFFETVIWHNQVHKDYSALPDGVTGLEDTGFIYTPHISAEYAYTPLPWLSVGLVCDFQNTSWIRSFYDNKDRVVKSQKENFHNLCILPKLRFNFLNWQHVGLYASFAAGIDINGGSQENDFGKRTMAGAAVDLRFLGIRAGSGHYWGFADFGGMVALKSPNAIFLFGSQLARAGFTYKF